MILKNLFILILLKTLLLSDINWIDMDSAYLNAKDSKKNIMVMLSRESCPGCEYMKDVVFENTKIKEDLKDSFESVYIDINKDFVPENLSYFGTPTFYFLDSKENILQRINGSQNINKFFSSMQEIKKK